MRTQLSEVMNRSPFASFDDPDEETFDPETEELLSDLLMEVPLITRKGVLKDDRIYSFLG